MISSLVKTNKRVGKNNYFLSSLYFFGVSKSDIIEGEFWSANSYILEYLFDVAFKGFKEKIKEYHPDKPGGSEELCIEVLAKWNLVKKKFAQKGIPKVQIVEEFKLKERPVRKRITRIAWPDNVPLNLTRGELAKILNCNSQYAWYLAKTNGYAVKPTEQKRIVWPAGIPEGLTLKELSKLIDYPPYLIRRHAPKFGYTIARKIKQTKYGISKI